ncbi:restriction endonuclease subunit S [Segatella copri]|uniref:Restriction endonuclease subunit S n=1 Tax=Segatella copri TaxID=165179 RepID=A0AAW9T916_9BACT|nr:restriction endonuclease subunit S [Segatella copri]MQN27757.1 restriction endonuclease subunit S [Segatella copri]MQN32230.1 restriction endonuclease subunit S [Segatella copri]MQN39088.1 restriction endonuclease subunit S [Segatella copri]MQN73944.1 restriction endonuclease subunit S [Segatella copri]MQO27961.1 restriction endonuclease subunit S [Segatella copri]
MEWKHYKMDELIEEISMGPFGSDVKKEFYVDNGVPILNGSNLQGFKLKEDSFGYLTKEKADSLKKCNAHRGDIIVTHRGTLGQIVYVPVNSKYDRYVISQSQFRFRCKADLVDVQYLVYYFHTREGQYKILANASQVGVPALARATSTFRLIDIKLPPLDDQRRIASILSSLDRKIELNNKINADLEEMAQAIFKNWFVDFEPFKDGKFVDSELGMIPKGWNVGRLDEIADVVGGSTPSKAKPEYYTQKGIAWLTPKDLSNHPAVYSSRGEIDITEEGYNSTSTKLMPKGTILFTSRAPIGYISIAQNDICTNQGFKSLVPKKAGTCFLYCFLKYVTPEIENKSTGSTFKEASGSLMKSLQVIMPEQKVFEDFETIVSPLFARIESLEKENSRLSLLRDTLLPRLMSGELEVPE